MTARPNGTRKRHEPTSNLPDPEEFAPFAKCFKCHSGYYDKQEALELYLTFFCPHCGDFIDMNSFSLEFIDCVNRFWKGGDL